MPPFLEQSPALEISEHAVEDAVDGFFLIQNHHLPLPLFLFPIPHHHDEHFDAIQMIEMEMLVNQF